MRLRPIDRARRGSALGRMTINVHILMNSLIDLALNPYLSLTCGQTTTKDLARQSRNEIKTAERSPSCTSGLRASDVIGVQGI